MNEVISCEHEDFEAHVSVTRLAENAEASERGEINNFVADVTVRCAECKQIFGFRCPDVGLLVDRPTVSATSKELRVPLISPAELELRGPLHQNFDEVSDDEPV